MPRRRPARSLEIAELAERAPFQLSGGQKKRVAIASVLVMNSELLLVDEPTAALDPRTSVWLLELLAELHAAGKTIVLATHDLDGLGRVADRCLVFAEDHRIVGGGTPAERLSDAGLLLDVNLVHEHSHVHEGAAGPHSHVHGTGGHHHSRPPAD